ncbi:NAD(P)-binding protein [Phlegmacium glaucopus]|nr:NAD(P)-binding protein [Phlegmacium glaucopus]
MIGSLVTMVQAWYRNALVISHQLCSQLGKWNPLARETSSTRVLFLGATGYVGGTVFSSFLDHPQRSSFIYTALIRSPEKAEKLKTLDHNVNVILGSTSDTDMLAKLAADADIVIDMVDSDSAPPVVAILSGLKARHEKTGTVPSYIHTSSTAIISDDAMGMFASDTIHSDLDVTYLNALPDTVIHRSVDSKIVDADVEGYVRTYLILPPFVFGPTPGKLNDIGIQNPDMTCVMWVKMGLECGGPRVIGEGKNVWGFVSNTDLSDLFLLLFNRIKANPEDVPHGREGYYFATGGEFTVHEYVSTMGEIMTKRGKAESSEPQPFTEEELDRYLTPLHRQVTGGNSRGDAHRAKSIGWKPTASREDYFKYTVDETEAFITDGSRLDHLTPAMILTPSLA